MKVLSLARTLREQTTDLDHTSLMCCLSQSPPPGSEAELRIFTREQAPRNPSSRTLPRQRLRTDLDEQTKEFYTRTIVLQPSLSPNRANVRKKGAELENSQIFSPPNPTMLM
jgi:hypothetical protein